MSGQSMSMATKGILCKTETTVINRYILPLDLKLETETIKLNLESPETIKLHLKIREE